MSESQKKRFLIGVTGPSSFSTDMMQMVEKLLGANFVLLYHDDTENLNHWLEIIDGVIFAGGVDIHPAIYNTSVSSGNNLSKFDYMRDLREIRILRSVMEKKIPTFGVCRGHQLLGIYYGMRLIPDITSSHTAHSPSKIGITLGKEEPAHTLKLLHPAAYRDEYKPAPNFDKDVIGSTDTEERIFVNSFHHQGILHQKGKEPVGVRIMGVSHLGIRPNDKEIWDNIVEFMDGGPNSHWLSVQWHPEYDWQINSHSAAIINKFSKIIKESKIRSVSGK